MRTTTHNSRTNAGGRVHGTRHNDRNFDVKKADNINPEKVQENIYLHLFKDKNMTFEQAELKFYEKVFGKQLQQTNENYVRTGHPERCKTMEQWKQLRRYCPEETVFQIGKMEKHVSKEQLWAVYKDYSKKLGAWRKAHGMPFTVLTMALHADEPGAEHIQCRRVWHYQDKSGTWKVGQEKALEAAGVPLPHPDKPEGRRNNRKMTFDAMTRGWWIECCYAHGIEVEREPLPNSKSKKSLDKEDMIREKYQKMLDATEQMKQELPVLQEQISDAKSELEAIEAAVKGKYDAGVEQFGEERMRTMIAAAKKQAEKDNRLKFLEKFLEYPPVKPIYEDFCRLMDKTRQKAKKRPSQEH